MRPLELSAAAVYDGEVCNKGTRAGGVERGVDGALCAFLNALSIELLSDALLMETFSRAICI